MSSSPALQPWTGASQTAGQHLVTTAGLVFPWILARAGRDPAYGGGPPATIIQDVLTLLIYFAIVKPFL